MHLEEILEELGIPGGNVCAAKKLSEQRIESARADLARLGDGCLSADLVAFGSLARQEVTSESDFDYLVLVDGIPDDVNGPASLLKAADELRRKWAFEAGRPAGSEVRGPGASGLFGTVIGAFDLVERIGLERDTNHSLTRRMLLLEESVSLLHSEVRERVVKATLDRYLTLPGVRPNAVPRYLLNDVIRYWRTVTVDYQAKLNAQGSPGLRYIKLLIPRKIEFASMLMSLLLCGKLPGHTATTESLAARVDSASTRPSP